MSDTLGRRERNYDLSFSGWLPRGLDGVLVLPSVRQGLLHGLRIAAGEPTWYAALRLSELSRLPAVTETLVSHARSAVELEWLPIGAQTGERWMRRASAEHPEQRLHLRRDAPNIWHWLLRDPQGKVSESGLLTAEHATELTDLILTAQYVLVAAVDYAACSRAQDLTPTHRIGIALRRPRARVHWLHSDPLKRPTFEHAHEDQDLVSVDIAWCAPGLQRATQLVRWAVDPRGFGFGTQLLHVPELQFPALDSARPKPRYLYGVTHDQSLARVDLAEHRRTIRRFSFAHELSAPVLVHGANDTDARCVIITIYDAVQNCAECLVLDAQRIEGSPLATIRLPMPIRCDQRAYFVSTTSDGSMEVSQRPDPAQA